MNRSVETTVCFFKDLYKTLKAIPAEEAGILMTALFAHVNDETPDLDGHPIAAALYIGLENQIDRLDDFRRTKSKAGRSGGERNKTEQTEANGSKQEQNGANGNKTEQTEAPYPYPYPYPFPDPKNKERRFTPPTPEAVAAYAAEKGIQIDAQRFVDFYASKGWKVGSTPMKDWKAAARNWAARDRTEAKTAFNFDQRHTDYDALVGW